MTCKNSGLRVCLYLLLVGVVTSAPAWAGSAVIGSVAGSMKATIGGQEILPNTTIFSGDSLQVNEGAAVVSVGTTSRVVFGRQTVASFLRDSNEVTVLLTQGNVSMLHPDDSVALRVKVGDISVLPANGFKTLGEVAMVNDTVVVTAKEGLLRVDRNGSAVEVAKGKTIVIPVRAAKAPTPAGGGGGVSSSFALQIAAVGAAGAGAVEAGVAISRANDAKDAANAANATAAQAVASANAATTAANNATAAANAATAAANTATQAATNAGCALNTVSVSTGATKVSPFTPPKGFTAPGC